MDNDVIKQLVSIPSVDMPLDERLIVDFPIGHSKVNNDNPIITHTTTTTTTTTTPKIKPIEIPIEIEIPKIRHARARARTRTRTRARARKPVGNKHRSRRSRRKTEEVMPSQNIVMVDRNRYRTPSPTTLRIHLTPDDDIQKEYHHQYHEQI